ASFTNGVFQFSESRATNARARGFRLSVP
ncbi:MAG: hypothetical protein RLZZ350_2482, partial [Verrucomicrobiota bacterium]